MKIIDCLPNGVGLLAAELVDLFFRLGQSMSCGMDPSQVRLVPTACSSSGPCEGAPASTTGWLLCSSWINGDWMPPPQSFLFRQRCNHHNNEYLNWSSQLKTKN